MGRDGGLYHKRKECGLPQEEVLHFSAPHLLTSHNCFFGVTTDHHILCTLINKN